MAGVATTYLVAVGNAVSTAGGYNSYLTSAGAGLVGERGTREGEVRSRIALSGAAGPQMRRGLSRYTARLVTGPQNDRQHRSQSVWRPSRLTIYSLTRHLTVDSLQ